MKTDDLMAILVIAFHSKTDDHPLLTDLCQARCGTTNYATFAFGDIVLFANGSSNCSVPHGKAPKMVELSADTTTMILSAYVKGS
jgi:hypothetical protein